MSSLKNHHGGFGLIGIIAIILVVGAIAGIGFFIHNHHTRTAPTSAETTNVVPPAPKAPSTSTTPTDEGATLIVKEWGVSIPLPASLKDAYYVPSTGSADTDGSINTIWLGLKSKDTETCGAALGNTGGSTLGGIVRVLPTDTDPVTGKFYSELLTGVQIEKYYYGFGPSLDADNKCGSVDSRRDINAAFGSATKSATATTAVKTSN